MLRRTKCSGIFQNGYFPPPPGSTMGFFSSPHCENLVDLEVNLQKCRGPSLPGPPGVSSSDFSTEPLAIHQLRFRFSCPSTGSLGDFCSWVSSLIFVVVLLICLSALGESSNLLCDFVSLRDLRRVVDFAVCPAFYLSGWSGDF